jgi:hypothetical protein
VVSEAMLGALYRNAEDELGGQSDTAPQVQPLPPVAHEPGCL